tara:strand:+ start:250 stop:633 length:384 start_codon:yes stop_codon:yes gene_type:complete
MILESLLKKVNNHFNIDITQNSRRREIVMARAAFYWLARKKTRYSTAKIGAIVNREHSSVLYSMKNFENWIDSDLQFKNKFENLHKIIFNELSVNDLTKKKLGIKYKFLKIAKNYLIIEVDKLKKQL